jgi:hypothetical protein
MSADPLIIENENFETKNPPRGIRPAAVRRLR